MKFDQDKDGYTDVSLKVRGDGLFSVLRILRHMQYHGDIGHSYGILLDPDSSEYSIRTGWDGDGSDAISDLKVNGKVLDKKKFDKEHLDMGKEREARIAAKLVARMADETGGRNGTKVGLARRTRGVSQEALQEGQGRVSRRGASL